MTPRMYHKIPFVVFCDNTVRRDDVEIAANSNLFTFAHEKADAPLESPLKARVS